MTVVNLKEYKEKKLQESKIPPIEKLRQAFQRVRIKFQELRKEFNEPSK